MLRKLSLKEELAFMKEIHGADDYAKLFAVVKGSFALIQARAQMLLGLATICLTITGFSGPRMAQSNAYSRFFHRLRTLLCTRIRYCDRRRAIALALDHRLAGGQFR